MERETEGGGSIAGSSDRWQWAKISGIIQLQDTTAAAAAASDSWRLAGWCQCHEAPLIARQLGWRTTRARHISPTHGLRSLSVFRSLSLSLSLSSVNRSSALSRCLTRNSIELSAIVPYKYTVHVPRFHRLLVAYWTKQIRPTLQPLPDTTAHSTHFICLARSACLPKGYNFASSLRCQWVLFLCRCFSDYHQVWWMCRLVVQCLSYCVVYFRCMLVNWTGY